MSLTQLFVEALFVLRHEYVAVITLIFNHFECDNVSLNLMTHEHMSASFACVNFMSSNIEFPHHACSPTTDFL